MVTQAWASHREQIRGNSHSQPRTRRTSSSSVLRNTREFPMPCSEPSKKLKLKLTSLVHDVHAARAGGGSREREVLNLAWASNPGTRCNCTKLSVLGCL